MIAQPHTMCLKTNCVFFFIKRKQRKRQREIVGKRGEISEYYEQNRCQNKPNTRIKRFRMKTKCFQCDKNDIKNTTTLASLINIHGLGKLCVASVSSAYIIVL